MRKIKLYLSASVDDEEIIMKFKENIDNAHQGKYELTCRWWDHLGNDKITYALQCMIGVKEANLFIMYNGEKKSSGKSIELGMALILGKPILIYGKPLTTIFSSLIKYCGDFLPNDLNEHPVKFDFFDIKEEET